MKVSEKDLLSQIIELAHLKGWLVAHFRPARTEKGWRTPVAADGAGFPDLVLVRGDRLIFAEVKSAKGKVRLAQQVWLDSICESRRAEVYVWRPADWEQIVKVLER